MHAWSPNVLIAVFFLAVSATPTIAGKSSSSRSQKTHSTAALANPELSDRRTDGDLDDEERLRALELTKQSVVHRLKRDLLGKYDKTVRPVRNITHVSEASLSQSLTFVLFLTMERVFAFLLQLYVSLGILALLNVDETESKIRAFVSTELNWMDEYISWNPDDYDGIEMITIPLHLIWTPDLMCDQTLAKQ